MGGQGSGRWYRYGARGTLDAHLCLEAWRVWRGYKRNGRWSAFHWTRGGNPSGSISVEVLPDAQTDPILTTAQGPGAVVFHYHFAPSNGEERDVENVVPLTWTTPNYGGKRPWFLCPYCSRRVGVVVIGGGDVKCRRCRGLGYAVCNEAPYDRHIRRRSRVVRRLGGEAKGGLFTTVPDKPPRMHWATYARLVGRYREADIAACRAMEQTLAQFMGLGDHLPDLKDL